MAPPNSPQGLGRRRFRQGGEQGAAATLLHGDRLAEHLQGTGLAQGLGQKGQVFCAGIVDLGLLQQQRLLLGATLGAAGFSRCPQRDAQQVGPIQAATAQPHPNRFGHIGGWDAKAIRPAGRQGQPRGRG